MLPCLLLLLLYFGHPPKILAQPSDRPNIVFIVADDLGWHDAGFNGGDVRTPNLDALAAQGVVLSRHYTLPTCSPSRAALMTGRHPIRSGAIQCFPLTAGSPLSLPLSEKIFPEYFHQLGYETHLVGKWHLGYRTPSHLPTRRGFDSFFGYYNGRVSYYDGTHSSSGVSGRDMRRNEEGAALDVYGKYLTQVLSDEAVSVVEKHPGRGGLLLFLMQEAPHIGNLPYPREAPPGLPLNATGRQQLRETVRQLDNSVGEVVAALNRKGVLNNTIIVFLSDNGAPKGDGVTILENYGSNWPLRGVKGASREGGVRTPSFIWTPMLREASRVTQGLFHISDWLPTLYTAAGGNLSDISSVVTLDGVDQWEYLTSSVTPPRTELLLEINYIYGSESYILENWKLVKDPPPDGKSAFAISYYGDSGGDFIYDELEVDVKRVANKLPLPMMNYSDVRNKTALKARCNDTEEAMKVDCYSKYCLYDLIQDPSECYDVASDHPEIVEMLLARLEDWRKVLVPEPSGKYDPRADPKNWNEYWSPWMEDEPSSGPHPTSSFIHLCVLILILNVLPYIFS